jgi:hypothetical protein
MAHFLRFAIVTAMGGSRFRTLTGWIGGKTRGDVTTAVERSDGFAHRRWMRNTIPLFAMVVLAGAVLAGCVAKPVAPVRAPATPPAARPAVVPRPVPPTGSDWRDWPVTAGDWAYRQDQGGSTALFGAGGGNAVLTLRCDAASATLYLSRQGSAATPLTIRTSTVARSFPVQPTSPGPAGSPTYVATRLAARDPLLDAIVYSRGRFIVEQAGAATLVVPAWAEIARVTEDCRR